MIERDCGAIVANEIIRAGAAVQHPSGDKPRTCCDKRAMAPAERRRRTVRLCR